MTSKPAPALERRSVELPAGHVARLEAGRRAILGAIGDAADIALLTGAGNRGDELIVAGARRLLSGLPVRELAAEEVATSEGELALIIGSGALSRAYHEWIPELLALAELRFERVILLPSTADTSEDRVRAALARTGATVFAREPRTLRHIQGLCDARLASDTAFYFDYAPYAGPGGAGTLNAFRTDVERHRDSHPPPDNDDISASTASLEEFLERIAAADLVRTDRAHVAIAAAMLGKRVEVRPGRYFKQTEIVRWSLAGFPVTEIGPHGNEPSRPAPRPRETLASGTVAVIATRDQPAECARAAEAAIAAGAGEVIVVDRNSDPVNRALLQDALPQAVRLIGGDRDPGRAGARALGAADAAGADSILLLDDGVVLEPGAITELERALAADPGLAAVAAAVRGPHGELEDRAGELTSHSAILIRATALDELPLDAGLGAFSDQEWCLRAAAAGLRMDVVADARAHRLSARSPAHAYPFAERMRRLELCESLALVRERHGLVLADVFGLLPELDDDRKRAALALDHLGAVGRHRFAAEWEAGALESILARPR